MAAPVPARKVLVWVYRRTPEGWHALVLNRAPPHERMWHPVTGHVDAGEDVDAAARREVLEETGLEGRLVDIGYEHSFRGTWRGTEYEYTERGFGLEAAREECALSPEHTTYRWVPFEEAERLTDFPEHREALRRLATRLEGT